MTGVPGVGKLHVGGHHLADFHTPRPRQEGDIRPFRKAGTLQERFPEFPEGGTLVDGVHERIPNIGERNALGREIRLFKGENNVQAVHIRLEFADAAFA